MISYEWIGLVGGTISASSGVPQIIKTVRSKSTESFSWGLLVMTVIGCSISVVYGFLVQHPAIYITSIIALVTYKPILWMKIYYEIYLPRKNRNAETHLLIRGIPSV
jgi:uncharacterized protein with PQ loop repeat